MDSHTTAERTVAALQDTSNDWIEVLDDRRQLLGLSYRDVNRLAQLPGVTVAADFFGRRRRLRPAQLTSLAIALSLPEHVGNLLRLHDHLDHVVRLHGPEDFAGDHALLDRPENQAHRLVTHHLKRAIESGFGRVIPPLSELAPGDAEGVQRFDDDSQWMLSFLRRRTRDGPAGQFLIVTQHSNRAGFEAARRELVMIASDAIAADTGGVKYRLRLDLFPVFPRLTPAWQQAAVAAHAPPCAEAVTDTQVESANASDPEDPHRMTSADSAATTDSAARAPRPSVYDYDSAVVYLDEFGDWVRGGIRGIAKRAGKPPRNLTSSRDRGRLSKVMAHAVATACGLDASERTYFQLLAARDRAESEDAALEQAIAELWYAKNHMTENADTAPTNLLVRQALKDAIALVSVTGDEPWLGQLVEPNLTLQEAQACLQLLQHAGEVSVVDGRLVPKEQRHKHYVAPEAHDPIASYVVCHEQAVANARRAVRHRSPAIDHDDDSAFMSCDVILPEGDAKWMKDFFDSLPNPTDHASEVVGHVHGARDAVARALSGSAGTHDRVYQFLLRCAPVSERDV